MSISLSENKLKELDKDERLWPPDINQFTPLMRQYLEIKYKNDLEILLLFRVGDFMKRFLRMQRFFQGN